MFVMKLLSWNIRGLGRLEKRSSIKRMVKDRQIDILLIQETKRSNIQVRDAKSVWPWDHMEFLAVDAEGNSGGQLCIWNPEVFVLSECCSTRNLIIISGTTHDLFECVVLNIYAPTDAVRRRKLWDLIINLKQHFLKPWCMGGDFNEIRFMSDSKGCTRRDRGMLDFNNFIDQLALVDIPLLGRKFTWCNSVEGERWSKIDRFLVEPVWLEKYCFKLWGLPRGVSDHFPLLLMEDLRNWGPRPFKFINAWLLHSNFLSTVEKCWVESSVQGWAGYKLLRKLNSLKLELKK